MFAFKDTLLPKIDWSNLKDFRQQKEFESLFNRHISADVIKLLSPQLVPEPHNMIFNEDFIYDKLIRPFEAFICDLPSDASRISVTDALETIKKLDQPSGLCRKILKNGDSIYSCNDCSLDQTCVVCLDCFNKGPHKSHNYRMATSGGAGCCDCGDVEAWTQNYACSEHANPCRLPLSLSDFEDIESRRRQVENDHGNILKKIEKLPTNMATRYFILCQACLNYAHKLITWDCDTILPGELQLKNTINDPSLLELTSDEPNAKNFFTVLFNDEVHTFDQVISTLVKVVRCSKITASIMASTVSREGRSLVLNETRETCKNRADSITRNNEGASEALKVNVMHGAVLAHQHFGLRLISFIQRMSTMCDAFRILTAFALFGVDDTEADAKTLLEKIMLSNIHIWKMARMEWNDLFTVTMLNDYSIKDKFSRILTRSYGDLMKDFISDDHELAVSALTMTAQVYTVPSLVCMLIEEERALKIMVETFLVNCRVLRTVNSYKLRNTFDLQALRRAFKAISDFKLLISIDPIKWTEQFRGSVQDSVKTFIELLAELEGMDSVKRQTGQHLEYEPDWESGMTLQQKLVQVITRYVEYISLDEQTLLMAVKATQFRLNRSRVHGKKLQYNQVNIWGHQVKCIHYDVSVNLVTVHLPLTRFAASLILELMARRPPSNSSHDESLIIFDDEESENKQGMVEIMESSLRTQVMIAQYRSGMWRRNGYSLVNQLLYYHSPSVRKEMFDRDILVIQECAATCNANEFTIHLLNKFKLISWFIKNETELKAAREMNSQTEEDFIVQTISIVDEFLQLLLTITSERHQIGLGQVKEEDVIKNEVIQLLCLGPSIRSSLLSKLYAFENEYFVTECIKSVANLKRSSESSTGNYELKPEYYERFNPYFYHHGRREQSNAIAVQLKRKKNAGNTLLCCPPPRPIDLTPQFINISELLKCDVVLRLIQTILESRHQQNVNQSDVSTKKFTYNELQLDKSLHLIGLGLYEQEKKPLAYNYLEAAQSLNIFELLIGCHESSPGKSTLDLMRWTMTKAMCVVELVKSQESLESLSEKTLDAIRIINFYCRKSNDNDSELRETKKKSAEEATKRRERIIAMMKASQQKFLNNATKDQLVLEAEDEEEEDGDESIQSCILCRDKQKVALNETTMVYLALVQRSTVLSKNRPNRRIPYYSITPSNQIEYKSSSGKSSLYSPLSDNSYTFDATFMPADLFFGPYISSCGHVLHMECWKQYFENIKKREISRPNRHARHVSFNVDQDEFLCPYCGCLSNVAIPILPNYTKFVSEHSVFNKPQTDASGQDLSAFLIALKSAVESNEATSALNTSASSRENKHVKLPRPKEINELLQSLSEQEALGFRDYLKTIREDKVSSTDCAPSLLECMRTLAQRIYIFGLDIGRKAHTVDHSREFMMTSWCISYTLQTIERILRSENKDLFANMESVKSSVLHSLIGFSCASVITCQPDVLQSLLIRKLRFLLVPEINHSTAFSCLDVDAFEMFVSLTILMPKLYSNFNSGEEYSSGKLQPPGEIPAYGWTTRAFNHPYFHNIMHLMAILNLTQIIVSTLVTEIEQDKQDYLSSSQFMEIGYEQCISTNEECAVLENFIADIVIASGHPNNKLSKINTEFVGSIKAKMLPFIRSCALFYHHLSRLNAVDSSDEFTKLCNYVNLTTDFKILLASQSARQLVKAWLRHSRVHVLVREALSLSKDVEMEQEEKACDTLSFDADGDSKITIKDADQDETDSGSTSFQFLPFMMPFTLIRQPHTVNRLIDLPYDYSELIDRISTFTCPSIRDEESRTPTMCLVCGQIFCSQSYCCQCDLNELASNYQLVVSQQRTESESDIESDVDIPAFLEPIARVNTLAAAGSAALNTFLGIERRATAAAAAAAAQATSSSSSARISQQLVGSCVYHAHKCSAGSGIFLRIRTCQVLLLSGKSKGTYLEAPYVDDHGEADYGLLRGNPLHLNREEYKRLQQLWLDHGIPERVSRMLEYSHYVASINWHLH